ncbi:unnamed protein product [Symbiodinium sp. CCMP2456]|nr:unnamed protein product [Symbiodinium sp. CCMP2456]
MARSRRTGAAGGPRPECCSGRVGLLVRVLLLSCAAVLVCLAATSGPPEAKPSWSLALADDLPVTLSKGTLLGHPPSTEATTPAATTLPTTSIGAATANRDLGTSLPQHEDAGGEPAIIRYTLPARQTSLDIDLVVAAFSENLSWVEPMLARVSPGAELRLYCKGPKLNDPRCLRIDNYGGEEYAYLTHITHFYDELAPITVFTLGSIYNEDWYWLKCRKLNFVLSQIDTPEKRQSFSGFVTMAHQAPDSFMEFEGYFQLKSYRNHAGGQNTAACRASITPLDKWFERFIPVNLTIARHTGVLYNPIFAVSREKIRQYPKSMYETLLKEILRCTAKEHEGVAEAGHYLERAWKPMFETYRPLAIKCSGHFGQKKGDPFCCNQTGTIGLPWTICTEGRPTCSGLVDGSGWGTCIPPDWGWREDRCPASITAGRTGRHSRRLRQMDLSWA